jgi:hypothetical protein
LNAVKATTKVKMIVMTLAIVNCGFTEGMKNPIY